jgi:hypothetical protein
MYLRKTGMQCVAIVSVAQSRIHWLAVVDTLTEPSGFTKVGEVLNCRY